MIVCPYCGVRHPAADLADCRRWAVLYTQWLARELTRIQSVLAAERRAA